MIPLLMEGRYWERALPTDCKLPIDKELKVYRLEKWKSNGNVRSAR